MDGGILLIIFVGLIALSPVIWFAWWKLADLGEPRSRWPHAV